MIKLLLFGALYFGATLFHETSPFTYVFVAPVIFGVIGHVSFKGSRLARRVLATLIPILSIPWVFYFGNLSELAGMIVLHSLVIGVFIVPVLEAIASIVNA